MEHDIEASGERCPCGAAKFRRVSRTDLTDGLTLHFDICDACGFDTYAYVGRDLKIARYEDWLRDKKRAEQKQYVNVVFKRELSLLQDQDVREFVVTAFDSLCPDYFWYIPASVKGHHPPICRTRGGLVHHTKLAVEFGDTFADMLGIKDDTMHAQIVAGILLHDMLKRGETEDETDTWPDHKQANRDHGRYCAHQLMDFMQRGQGWPGATRMKLLPVINAVRLHMGRWTWELRPDEHEELILDTVVRTVHLADYAASRSLHQYLAARSIDERESMSYIREG